MTFTIDSGIWKDSFALNAVQDGTFRGLLPKICCTYPTMMKLDTVIPYLKKIQETYESRNAPLEFCWHQHFFTRNQQILLYQEIQIKFWYIISNSFNFFGVFKVVLINMVTTTLMISAKMTTLDLLKIKVFWNKGCDVIILSMASPTKFNLV